MLRKLRSTGMPLLATRLMLILTAVIMSQSAVWPKSRVGGRLMTPQGDTMKLVSYRPRFVMRNGRASLSKGPRRDISMTWRRPST